MIVPPCKDCEFRRPGCHAKCEPYKEWRKPLDKAIEEQNMDRKIQDTAYSGFRRREKWFRKNGRK